MTPVTTIADVRAAVAAARALGQRIGFVPTMGALHEGHASLIRRARARCDYVVVSIFVNPTQFGPGEDFERYPRTIEADLALITAEGGHLTFVPSVSEMYTEPLTTVEVAKLGEHLCGQSRPIHFRGVATVVLKLLNIVAPDLAVFGAKDGQQARIIRKMARDLNLPCEIDIAPTVRESDGLALSSRNRYLSPDERATAAGIYRALLQLKARAASEVDIARLESALHAELASLPGARVDYARIVDDEYLQPMTRLDRPALAAVAVWFGGTRLIDNIPLP